MFSALISGIGSGRAVRIESSTTRGDGPCSGAITVGATGAGALTIVSGTGVSTDSGWTVFTEGAGRSGVLVCFLIVSRAVATSA